MSDDSDESGVDTFQPRYVQNFFSFFILYFFLGGWKYEAGFLTCPCFSSPVHDSPKKKVRQSLSTPVPKNRAYVLVPV